MSLVETASVAQAAAEAVSQTRLDHQMMVGPLTLIGSNLRAHFSLVLVTTLPETHLSCCVMTVDFGRRGNIMLLDFGLRKRRWTGRGRLTDVIFKRRDGC